MMHEALAQRVTGDVIAGLPGWRALAPKGASPEYQMTLVWRLVNAEDLKQ